MRSIAFLWFAALCLSAASFSRAAFSFSLISSKTFCVSNVVLLRAILSSSINLRACSSSSFCCIKALRFSLFFSALSKASFVSSSICKEVSLNCFSLVRVSRSLKTKPFSFSAFSLIFPFKVSALVSSSSCSCFAASLIDFSTSIFFFNKASADFLKTAFASAA